MTSTIPRLTLTQVSELTGISTARLRQLIAGGKLRAKRQAGPGGRDWWEVKHEELAMFMLRRRASGRPRGKG